MREPWYRGSSPLAPAGPRTIKIECTEGDFASLHDRSMGEASRYFVWPGRGKEGLVDGIVGARQDFDITWYRSVVRGRHRRPVAILPPLP